MRHISLDESFWRSAAEALGSGDPFVDVESSLLDVSLLVQDIYDVAGRAPGSRLDLVALAGTEEERVLGLVLAALVARRGRRVLLVDLDIEDETWTRLLGLEQLDGVVDHIVYGTPVARLVRRTAWEDLAILPTGAIPTNASAVLRSDKLRAAIDRLRRDHDLLCVGLPYDAAIEMGTGAAGEMERAILIGPGGDELGFELALPRLLQRVSLLATLDVAPLGRERSVLEAALPGIGGSSAMKPSAGTGDLPRRKAEPGAWRFSADEFAQAATRFTMRPAHRGEPAEPHSVSGGLPLAPAPAGVPAAAAPRAAGPSSAPVAAAGPSGPAGSAARTPEIHPAHVPPSPAEPAHDLPSPSSGDPESRADMEFLSRLSTDPAPPPALHPKLRPVQERLELATPRARAELRELAEAWYEADGEQVLDESPYAPTDLDEPRGRVGATALAVALCLVLGAGAFWYWHSNQQIPDGEFTFIDSARSPLRTQAETGQSERRAAAAEAELGMQKEAADEAPGLEGSAAEGGAESREPAADARPSEGREPDAAVATSEGRAGESAREATEGTVEGVGREAAGKGGVAAGGAEDGRAIPEATAETAFTPPKQGPALGFSLHVGSFQTYEAAQRAARALREVGQPAFIVPVLLEGKGEWYRVFVGALADGRTSETSLERVIRTGAVAEGTVRQTPWALYLGTFETREAAAETIAKLANSGVSTYLLGPGPAHLYAGAFESAGDAELLNRQLRDRGFEAALVRRRGVDDR